MTRAIESFILIVTGVLMIFIIPILLDRAITSITVDSYEQKVVDQLAYKIQTEKLVYASDLYNYDGIILAYEEYGEDNKSMVSWNEISGALMENSGMPYVFKEKYVQLITSSGKVTSLRIN